ncbi:hypothetical protein ACFORJ_05250 [Corynebacterium hansenii]|uniref:Secreted protein n=1 Tax=Corynebacterium hansenii TaxID=394964 RepID=A0ABV7ZLY1_9CORY|nr:hypothetical protein [Corynebacterium hansenii]WJZ00147.1 hypothetical protein CHAN_07685 [Corynebacterium hansenii]
MARSSAPAGRRTGAVILAIVLVLLGAAAVGVGRGWFSLPGVPGIGGIGGGDLKQVRGIVGSEKQGFFADPEVRKIFARNGIEVVADTAGSRRIATDADLSGYAFAFPSSAPAAQRVAEENKHVLQTTPFHSPMAVATFRPIVDVLAAEGIARERGGHWYIDMEAYFAKASEGKRWRDLGGGAYPSPRTMQMSTTDPRTSNSAGMYVSILSWVGNGGSVVADPGQVDAAIASIAPVMAGQGYAESTSAAPFADYLSQGMGAKPMTMVYEAQFLEQQLAGGDRIADDMVLAYPEPTIQSKHTVVAFDEDGAEVARLLAEDADLQRLAAEHGFRPLSRQVLDDVLADRGVTAPPELVAVIDPPGFDLLERLLEGVGAVLGGAARPTAADQDAGAVADAPVGR